MTKQFSLQRIVFVIILILFSLSAFACTPVQTPTPFRPPTGEPPLIEPTLIIQPTKPVVIIQSTLPPTMIPTASPKDCVNDLSFISDVTIPDNTFVTYGSSIDKQWLVQNSGTCNWDSSYRLRHLGGAALGASEEAMLYPARAGTQATIQILFTAPFTDGVYESAWQAYDPNGNPFGQAIYIRITVAAP
jgi:Ig-like domain-containing protein